MRMWDSAANASILIFTKHCKHHPRMIQMVGLLWFTMVYYGLLWIYYGFTMGFSTLDSDVELVLNGIQWDSMICHPHQSTAAPSGIPATPCSWFAGHRLVTRASILETVDRVANRHPVWSSESRCAINSQNSANPCSKLKKT